MHTNCRWVIFCSAFTTLEGVKHEDGTAIENTVLGIYCHVGAAIAPLSVWRNDNQPVPPPFPGPFPLLLRERALRNCDQRSRSGEENPRTGSVHTKIWCSLAVQCQPGPAIPSLPDAGMFFASHTPPHITSTDLTHRGPLNPDCRTYQHYVPTGPTRELLLCRWPLPELRTRTTEESRARFGVVVRLQPPDRQPPLSLGAVD